MGCAIKDFGRQERLKATSLRAICGIRVGANELRIITNSVLCTLVLQLTMIHVNRKHCKYLILNAFETHITLKYLQNRKAAENIVKYLPSQLNVFKNPGVKITSFQ